MKTIRIPPSVRGIKTGILVDPMGHGFGEVPPEMEIEGHVHDYTELLRPNRLDWYRLDSAHEIKVGTRLVLFDYGGMLPGSDGLISSEARALIQWANDNPSALVVVISSFTYRNYISYEMEELGLKLHNVVCRESIFEDPIPLWFRIPGSGVCPAQHAIAGLTPLGGTLPDAQWFKPKPSFVKWFVKQFKNERTYEAGSGMGHTAKELHEAGCRIVHAIDANLRPGAVFGVEVGDATDYDYMSDSVILICRPCHGAFCEAVIQRALFRRSTAIIYVGLEKNIGNDLGAFREHFSCEMDNAGKDGESVYVWRPAWNQPAKLAKKTKARRKI